MANNVTFNPMSGVGKKIKEAADQQRLLQITYIDAKDKPTIRTVEPYEVKEGKLFAFDISKEAIRAFQIDRIQSAELHLTEYAARWPIQI